MSVENKEINAENEKNTEVVEIKEAISPSLAAEALEAEYEENIENKPFLTYEDFGAVGDGEADDFPAIIACHAEANRLAKPVKVKEGAVYYISGMNNTAIIKTNTDFSNAKFVIDDRELENKSSWVFSVEEDRPSFELTVTSLEKNQKTVNIPHLGNIYVKVQNENRRMFVRNGMHMENGFPTRDCFTVDESGNVLSPIDWDYPEITGAYAKSIDDTPITISGGIFTTVANESPAIYNYHARGIKITRSNVTIENVTHLIENEGENGAPYLGFINISETANVKVKNCKLTAHTTYYTESTVEGKLVPMESFDLSISNSVGVKIVNLSQTNDIFDKSKSGIFHSNFCKNLVLDGCTLSRIDSHEGVSNITVKNCKVGHKGISLFGFGEALIENTESCGAAFISLRGDYGSHWDGNITVKNCTWTPATQNMRILGAWNKGMHDFGYECSMPRTLSITGLKINDSEFDLPVYIFGMYDDEYTENKPYPYTPCEILAVKDIELASGKDYKIIQKAKLLGDIKIVKDHFTYEDFGAKGDGVTDDMPAIIACHEAANKVGFPVKAKDNAVYYISPETRTAIIKTSVDFGTATFIIDDVGVDLEKRGTSIFRVVPDTNYRPFTIDSLKKNQTQLDFPHEGTVFVKVQNNNKKIFIREGLNMNAGKPTVDNFVVDASGKVLCPIDWDYDEFTLCEYKSADDTPITICGGTFKTIANQAESFYNYHARNFNVNRCNVTIKGVTHLVEGELDHGAPYGGFFNIGETYNVLIEDCLLTPHLIYYTESKVPGKPVAMGSYDINVNNSVKATLRRITQTVDIMDKRYWGLIHTNFCKDLLVEDCVMSRYDAHEGVSNITIRGCTLGHQCLNLIGFGEALIENTKGFGNAFIVLRPDYGSFWHGNITIKNCVWQPSGNGMNHVIYAKHNGTHDFGYPCSMPTRLTINGFKVLNGAFEDKAVRIVTPYCDPAAERTYDYGTIKVLTIKDFVTESGEGYNVCTVPELLPDIKVNDGVLNYEDFGAVGDGVTDDFDAIIACHNLANKAGLPVKAKNDATYYIGPAARTATIKTSVDFGNATFIIDDVGVDLAKRGASLFNVVADTKYQSFTVDSITKNQKKIDIPHEGNIFVRVKNANKKIFIREGLNMNAGKDTMDYFTVDKDGKILCPIDWNYDEFTLCEYKSADDTPITIEGGIFRTIANQAESFYNYHSRNFNITRSNVTFKNVTHYVEGELDHGAPYAGFINVSEATKVVISNCVLTPHFIYSTPSKVPGKLVPMGSYDINVNHSVDVTIRGITQTVDIMDRRYWGLIHTNFCKNLLVEDCIMSRYDAHEGVSNITIRGCTLGHQCLNLIGFGEALIENTKGFGYAFIALRGDFGSFWHGNITIKNCVWQPARNGATSIISAYHNGTHDFGYPCSMPTTVTINGLKVLNGEFEDKSIYIVTPYCDPANERTYDYGTIKVVTVKDLETESGEVYNVCKVPELLPDVKINDGVLHYEDFGAIGDGVADDFDAIVACHELANKAGLPVKAKDDATYYIGGKNKTAIIKTDTDFSTAKFIIDDRNVEDRTAKVFLIQSDNEVFTPDIKTLAKGQTKVDNPYDAKVMMRIFYSGKKRFIRKGANMNNGTDTSDCIVVDKDGTILTSVDWDYPEITSAVAKKVDDAPITVKGGIFTTIANQAESFYTYYGRGIMVERANVLISGITHYVEGELDHGAPYGAFLHFDLAYNVDVEDCLLTPHFIYYTPSMIPGQMVPMGSYDINVNASVDIHFRRVTQTIDINDKKYWGIYGSNFTKNILLEDCNLSRYDAHQGVSGLTIKNCVFGHQGVSIIGYGDAYVENTHVYGRAFFNIRGDYGSVWFGNIIAKNCELTPTFDDYYIVSAHNPGDHDFGYTTKMADSIVLDGFTVHNEGFSAIPYVFNNYTDSTEKDCPFPYILPDKITLKNMKADDGKQFKIAPNPKLFANVDIEND